MVPLSLKKLVMGRTDRLSTCKLLQLSFFVSLSSHSHASYWSKISQQDRSLMNSTFPEVADSGAHQSEDLLTATPAIYAYHYILRTFAKTHNRIPNKIAMTCDTIPIRREIYMRPWYLPASQGKIVTFPSDMESFHALKTLHPRNSYHP